MKKKYLKTCTSVLAVTAVLLSACGGPQQKKRREDNDGDCKTGGFYQKKI